MIRHLPFHLIAVLLFVSNAFIATPLPVSTPISERAVREQPSVARPRVNVPYNVGGGEAAIFWFGRVTSSDNYADVRIGYRDEYLWLHLSIIDRLLWYDPSPQPGTLTDWDAVSLYLSDPSSGGQSPHLYRFDAQLSNGEDRSAYQTAHVYDGTSWSPTAFSFTTQTSWNGDYPNNTVDDRGWSLLYRIPYSALGLSGPPLPGEAWAMGLVIHDRDAASGPTLSHQIWPPEMVPTAPETWGVLRFGAPSAYDPPQAVPGGVLNIRDGVDGAVVVDGDVGGSSTCGAPAGPDFFPTWGDLNYAGKEFVNIQNLGHISEWPCFSKYYVTFPLDALPSDRIILSAQLILYQFGNAGEGETPGPQPSLIQVSTIAQDWEADSLTWNTAPLPVENIATAWVDPLEGSPAWPGIPRVWDVSAAVAGAYVSGGPVRLVLYSPDWDFHSGKYFYSSEIGGTGAGRPTLEIHWGEPLAQLEKSANTAVADYGQTIDYTVRMHGVGTLLTLTDTLPDTVAWVGNVGMSGTDVEPVYHSGQHRLTWNDSPALGQQVLLTYTTRVQTLERQLSANVVELVDDLGNTDSATATVIVNPRRYYLPLLLKP